MHNPFSPAIYAWKRLSIGLRNPHFRQWSAIGSLARVAAFLGRAFAAEVSLAWDPVTSNQLGGYELQYREASGNYENSIDVGANTSFTVAGLQNGQTYAFRVRAYSQDRSLWSGFSNEVTRTLAEPIPVAGFAANQTTGISPLTVLFTDTSSGSIDTRMWQFGDGGSASDTAMVTHTYNVPGIYTVQLAVNGPGGTDVEVKTDYIIVQEPQGGGDSGGTAGDNGSGEPDGDSGISFTNGTMEVGEISLDDKWRRINFQQNFIDPVVVVKPLSGDGSDPSVIRINNVDASGFQALIQPWDYLGNTNAIERAAYLVIERGHHLLPNGAIVEAGTLDTNATDTFAQVLFSAPFTQAPVVLAGVSTFNGGEAVATRTRNIDQNGFSIKMQEQEANPPIHSLETLAYIALEPTSDIVEGRRVEVGRTGNAVTNDAFTIGFSSVFDDAPLFLADMQTTDGGDTANVRWTNKSFQSVDIWIDEEQSRDAETNHTTESIGYVAIEAGTDGGTNGGAVDIELIVDNQDPNTESTGTWSGSSGADPWAGQSVYSNGASVFRWLPAIPESGRYQVYAWWTYHANRSSLVPYRIGHAGGVSTVTVNQHDPAQAGRWIPLGEYDFAAGAGYVEVSSENGQANADAVKLIKTQ